LSDNSKSDNSKSDNSKSDNRKSDHSKSDHEKVDKVQSDGQQPDPHQSTANHPRLLGFLECPSVDDPAASDGNVVVIGVPYDLATTGRAGAREGPDAIRRASPHISWEHQRWPWRFALHDRIRLVDAGDVEFQTGDSRSMVAALQTTARSVIAAGKTLLTFGGDHFISLPILREHAAKYGPISLVHFDAHADTEDVEGEFNHGNMFLHAQREGLIDPARSVQVGIRTEYAYETYPMTVLDATWVHEHSPSETAAKIASVVGNGPSYLSFDIDCLDPAFAPGTGTPHPGGLSTRLALEILRGLVGCNLVGMDIVEVAPAYDHAEITALAAASIAAEFLYVLAATPSDLEASRN
jgi:agmatinase